MFKKLTLTFCFLGCTALTQAQESKEAVYNKIENSYPWLNYAFLEKCATLNFTDEQWTYALKNEYVGLDIINGLGDRIANYFEILVDNNLGSNCRYGSDKVDCVEKVEELAPKLKIEMNMQQMKMSPERFKLAMYSLSTIGSFLGSSNIYGVKSGWRQKGSTLKIILNIDNGTGQPIVTWNSDKTEATVKMFVGAEVGDWSDNILKALEKGGTK